LNESQTQSCRLPSYGSSRLAPSSISNYNQYPGSGYQSNTMVNDFCPCMLTQCNFNRMYGSNSGSSMHPSSKYSSSNGRYPTNSNRMNSNGCGVFQEDGGYYPYAMNSYSTPSHCYQQPLYENELSNDGFYATNDQLSNPEMNMNVNMNMNMNMNMGMHMHSNAVGSPLGSDDEEEMMYARGGKKNRSDKKKKKVSFETG